MKKLLTTSKMVALAAGVVSVAQIASATPVPAGVSVNYTYSGETDGGLAMQMTIGSASENVLVGQFQMTTSNPNFSSTLLTYCTDLGAELATGPSGYTYTGVSLTAAPALETAANINPAWVTGGLANAAKLWYNDKGAATTAIQTAGLQLAIWELLYNNVSATANYTASTFTSGGNGAFHVTQTSTSITAAETYAASVLDAFVTGTGIVAAQNVEWLAPTTSSGQLGGSQGLLYQTPGGTNLTAPDVTSTLPLFGAVIMALGVASRKLSGKA